MKSTTIFTICFLLIYTASCGTTPTETAQTSPTEAVKTATNTIPPPTVTAVASATPTEKPPSATPTSPPPTATASATPTQPTSTPWPTLTPPFPITYYIGFNTTKPPFDDVEVRRAFAQAIDRDALVDALKDAYDVRGIFRATSLVPPDIWPDGRYLYEEIGLFPDPDQDAEPIEPWWDTSIQIIFASMEGNEIDNRMLQDQWRERLGVEVELVFYDAETYDQQLDSVAPHIFYYGWYADYASPYNFLADAMHDIARWTNWSNDKYDQIVDDALVAADADRSMLLYEEAERILCEEEAVIAPLYHFVYYPPE